MSNKTADSMSQIQNSSQEKNRKLCAVLFLAFFFAGLIPVFVLGTYNHPTGDDYYYGVETHHIWESSHNLFAVLAAAADGVKTQYQIWQGTYSAMFFMYLPPNIFGENAYRVFTTVILLSLSGGIFYFLRQLLCRILHFHTSAWLILSSLAAFLCVQTVDFQPESFFWYNGSMYYTGFFSLSLFFLGSIFKWLTKPDRKSLFLLCPAALFLAGGNYISLLPSLLILFSITFVLIFIRKEKKTGLKLFIVCCFMLAGLAVSALAPGNAVRQSGMWKISPGLAILKAIRQGIRLLLGWTNPWCFLALLTATPFLWSSFKNSSFRFRYPVLAVGYAFGLFCSMSCPTYYTMNSIDPARAIAIMYYAFILFLFFSYTYLLGYFYHQIHQKHGLRKFPSLVRVCRYVWFSLIPVLILVQLLCGQASRLTVVRAVKCLVSREAAAYEAEYQDRLRQLIDPKQQVIVFLPYQHPADLLYVGDLGADPDSPNNQRTAEYFHKESICVKWYN